MLFRKLRGWPSMAWESPFGELERMRKQMDLLSDRFTRGVSQEPFAGVFPLLNVTEDRDNYYVRAELPGIKAADLDISVTGDSLSISGERRVAEENEGAKYHRRERDAGKFSRIVRLPGQVDTQKADAQCAEGILTVTLPKAEIAKPKQITVTAS